MATSRLLDRVYKNFIWIIVLISIVGYLAYRTIQFEGDIGTVLRSFDTWLNIAFSVWLHLNILQAANNSGISQGLSSDEFTKADSVNNKMIQSVNNEMTDFRSYVKRLNYNERLKVEEDYLFKCGVLSIEELTKKQKKKLKQLKPVRHDIYGFNLPLFYEMTSNGVISYKANYLKNQGLWYKRVSKVISGILFGLLTINIAFNVSGLGEAMISVVIMSTGLILTFLMIFIQPYFKLRYEVPKNVILKATLYNGYVAYKSGEHQLKPIDTNVVVDNYGNVVKTIEKDTPVEEVPNQLES